ncbi:MAG TPA: C4-type zinc ribbon domain-containing protein [Blastocatellia bacterium]|nr:C4-type zinc ribbon domain-containing protein [Blastocatellia bacterium]
MDVDLAEYEQSHEKFKADLMKVRNQNEYGTVLREIDATKKSISALETEALQLIERIEAREKELTEKAPEFAARRAEVDQLLATFDHEVERIQAEIDELRSKRGGIAKEVSPNMLRVYDRIAQTRKGRAMSEVRGEKGASGKCSACNMALRPAVFSLIRRGEELIVCDNCSRILFYRPEQAAPIEASAS